MCNRLENITRSIRKKVIKAYGFISSPNRSPRHSASIQLALTPTFEYWNRPTNKAFHDLTTTTAAPLNLRSLLGLGLKFIPAPYRTTNFAKLTKPDSGIAYIDRSLRLRCFFCAYGTPNSDMEYDKRFHITSKFKPDERTFPKPLTARLRNFGIRLRQLFRNRKSHPNLSRAHRQTLEYLRTQKEFIIANCDKNLGPAIIERDRYIRFAIKDHLSDTTTYERLSKEEADLYLEQNKDRMNKWLIDHKVELNEKEWQYIHYHTRQLGDTLPQFYLLMKVHKIPLKTRPIVSFPGSLFHPLGVWIDKHLQTVAKTFPTYLQSSFDLLEDFKTLQLPPHRRYRLFTADATSMYTNLPTKESIQAIHDYIVDNQKTFPFLPITPLTEALELLMNHNVFQFGDTFFRQTVGAAMGAPPSPTYANSSFATHELKILNLLSDCIAYWKRYIDDIFGIWICHPDPLMDEILWSMCQRVLNDWHGLQWKISKRSDTVVFLDLTLRLRDGKIHSTLFEKPLNLYLYLPAKSAHPPGALYGLIAGFVFRALTLCTDKADALSVIAKMFRNLQARGYSASTLRPIFSKAMESRDNIREVMETQNPNEPDRMWLFKLTYHPNDPPSHLIRKAWNKTVAEPPLSKPLRRFDIRWTPIGDRRFVVCYRRPANLGNILSYRKLKPNSGPEVSSYFI